MRRTPFVGNDGGVVAADSFVVAKKPPHNETFQPVYPASVYLQGVGGSVAPVVRGSSGETVDPPEGTKYAFQEGTFVPQGVTIDPATGVISVGTDSKPGERGLEVVVTHPDGTVDEVIADARLEANDAAKFQPEYPPATLERGQEVTLRPEFKDAADEPVAAPGEVKYRHKDGAVELPTGVSLAEDGSVTVGADTPAGTYHVLMTVTYPDKSSEDIGATFTVTEKNNETFGVSYPETRTVHRQLATASPEFTDAGGEEATLPEGTRFAPINGLAALPKGMTLNAETGEFTVALETAKGTYEGIVVVTYPDGSQEQVPVKLDVGDNQADRFEASYANLTLSAGQGGTMPLKMTDAEGNPVEVPEGTTFVPRFAVSSLPAGVSINELTGEFTVVKDMPKGTYAGWVRVTYPDTTVAAGEQARSRVSFTTKGSEGSEAAAPIPEGTRFSLKEVDGEVDPKGTVALENTGGKLPVGATADAGDKASASVDPETGKLTVVANENAKPGDEITVTVKDAGGNVIDTVTLTVSEGQAGKLSPGYGAVEVAAGTGKTVSPNFTDNENNGVAAPDGTSFAKGGGENVPDWVTVNEEDGSLSVRPDAGVAPGDYEVPVVVTYLDGSTDTVKVKVTVSPGIVVVKDQGDCCRGPGS